MNKSIYNASAWTEEVEIPRAAVHVTSDDECSTTGQGKALPLGQRSVIRATRSCSRLSTQVRTGRRRWNHSDHAARTYEGRTSSSNTLVSP
jgi:hypothetical protein